MTLQTLTPAKDAHIQSNLATTNFGGDIEIRLQNDGVVNLWSLLEFDLSGITDRVISAFFRLRIVSTAGGSINWAVYRIRRLDWVEAEATWNIYRTANNWTTAGAEHVSDDRDTSISSTGSMVGSLSGWFTFGDLKEHAQDAIDNHNGAMAIIVVQTNEVVGARRRFHSKENGDSSLIPQLLVSTTKSGFLLYDR